MSELKLDDEDIKDIKILNVRDGSRSWVSLVVLFLVAFVIGFIGGYVYKSHRVSLDIIQQAEILTSEKTLADKRNEVLDEKPTIKDVPAFADQVISITESDNRLKKAVDDTVAYWRDKFNNKQTPPIIVPEIPQGLITWAQCKAANVVRPGEEKSDRDAVNAYRRNLGLEELR